MDDRYEITVERRDGKDLFHVWDKNGVLVHSTDSLKKARDWLDSLENKPK